MDDGSRQQMNADHAVETSSRIEMKADQLSWYIAGLTELAMMVITGLVVAGGTIPYYFQYREIVRTQNAKGFSLYVCLTLLMANILRILFWCGRRYELPLLFQSMVMTTCMLVMIDLSVRIQRKDILPPRQLRTIWDGHFMSNFWQWTDLSSYAIATITFAMVMSLLTRAFLFSPLYVEMIGFLALFLEANLGTPQLWANYARKSTAGMSVNMVFMWLFGDISKTVYFLIRQTPAQFWTCGLFQVFVDIVILLQARFYRRSSNNATASNPPILLKTKSDLHL